MDEQFLQGLRDARALLDEGVFTQEEFNCQKQKLLTQWNEREEQTLLRRQEERQELRKLYTVAEPDPEANERRVQAYLERKKERAELDKYIIFDPDPEPRKQFTCDKCQHIFTKRVDLAKHMENVHLCVLPRFKCNLCQVVVSTKKVLDNHMFNVHSIPKPFQCDLCQFGASTETDLKKHIKTIHLGLKSLEDLKGKLRGRVCRALKAKNFKKHPKTRQMIGCSWELFQEHMQAKKDRWNQKGDSQRKFEKDDKLHTDHIKPLSAAKNEEELKELFHFTNCQPLWADTNILKNDHWTEEDDRFWRENIFMNPNYKDIYLPRN